MIGCMTCASAQKVIVFASSSLTDVLLSVVQAYQKRYPQDKVLLSFGASSLLAKQIDRGAPANIFISANQQWVDFLRHKHPQRISPSRIVAYNQLVLITPKSAGVFVPPSASVLSRLDYQRILADGWLAVGDPDHVPAGMYAKQALQKAGVWNVVLPRLARAKNVCDALILVERAEAVLGIVYATDVYTNSKVRVLHVFPPSSHERIVYPAVFVGEPSAAASRLMDFLLQARSYFIDAGFGVDSPRPSHGFKRHSPR